MSELLIDDVCYEFYLVIDHPSTQHKQLSEAFRPQRDPRKQLSWPPTSTISAIQPDDHQPSTQPAAISSFVTRFR